MRRFFVDRLITGFYFQFILFDQVESDRASYKSAGHQAKGSRGNGDRFRTDNAQALCNGTESGSGPMASFKGNGTCHDAEHGVDPQQISQSGSKCVLKDRETPTAEKINDKSAASPF